MDPTPPLRLSAGRSLRDTQWADAQAVERWLEDVPTGPEGQALLDAGLGHLARHSASGLGVRSVHEQIRIDSKARSLSLLLERGARHLPLLDTLLGNSHRQWGQRLLWELCARATHPNDALTPRGEALLHRLGAQGNDWVVGNAHHSPWFPWPVDSIRTQRPCDGATPLHLVLSAPDGLAAIAMTWASEANSSWMANEVFLDAIGLSRYLVEALGADWDEENHQGQTAGEALVSAWDNGLHAWHPNAAGAEWILPIIDRERERAHARGRRRRLEGIVAGRPDSACRATAL